MKIEKKVISVKYKLFKTFQSFEKYLIDKIAVNKNKKTVLTMHKALCILI